MLVPECCPAADGRPDRWRQIWWALQNARFAVVGNSEVLPNPRLVSAEAWMSVCYPKVPLVPLRPHPCVRRYQGRSLVPAWGLPGVLPRREPFSRRSIAS